MKKIKILLIALILILGGVFFGNSYAAKGDIRTLGASLTRPFENIKYQYLVPGDTTDLLYTIVKIYDNSDKDAEDNLAFTKALYCLRGGIGFGAEDVATDPVTYTEIGEMHLDASDIITNYMNKYKTGKNGTEIDINTAKGFTVSKTENGVATQETKTVNLYNAILWIIDESYLPIDKTKTEGEETVVLYDASEYKKELLDKAGVPTSEQADITDNDIEVIQQLAMWYFTNYDEQLAGIKPTVSQSTMFPAQFLSIDENNNIDNQRANNLDRIYQYFIYGAIENADAYTIDETTGARTKSIEENKFDKTKTLQIASYDIEGIYDYYEIGPVKFESNASARNTTVNASDIVVYDAKGNVISKEFEIYEEKETVDGEEIVSTGKHVVYKFLDSNGNEVTELIKGQEYKIRIYKAFEEASTVLPNDLYERYDMSKFTVKVTSTYSLSNATFLSAGNESQPVVEIEKEKLSSSDEITTEYYDLALRKFISAINGNILEGTNSRIPSIDLSKLNTIDTRTNKKITTAIYTHSKNALLVETGDKVIYTIRIYNEGEIDGKALEITDYLPVGLELVPASESEINTTYGWVAGEGNIITTDYLKDTAIKAYDSTKETLSEGETGWQKADDGNSGLYYADVQVECKVIAQVSNENQSLRNIAEISNADGNDRDSNTNNVDTNNYIPPVDNSEYQQDDDDYEDLLLEADSFDLALRKYIVAIDGSNLEGEAARTPNISTEPFMAGETTADYKHRKYPVQVEIGNIVTYRFTVYNEGDIDGYVYSIIDYLPEGLTFDEESNTKFVEYKEQYTTEELEGKEYVYKIERNKLTIIPLNTNSLFELVAFNGSTLDSKSIDVKFKVTAPKSNKDQILTNVATMIYGAKGTDLADRDSNKTGEEFTVPTAEELLANLTGYKGNTLNKDELQDGIYHYKGQQDDDDFEKIIIKGIPFDLSLRKFITSIKRNGEEVELDNRMPSINTETLIDGTFNRNGVLEHTATYEHSKEPVVVKQGDIITYTLRVYNEGERAGFATEITDYIPEGLALVLNYNTNFNNGWRLPTDLDNSKIMNLVGEDGFYKTEEDIKNLKLEDFSDTASLADVQLITGEVSITTNELDNQLLEAFDKTLTEETAGDGWQKAEAGEGGLYYKDVQVSCLVIAENAYKETITNIAEISEDKDENGNDVIDRDSTPNNKQDPYETSQEDDDDYEPVVLRYFDLALRKFITGVETNGGMTQITSRIPSLSIDEETGNIVYTHPKEEAPVEVANNDIVIYTLRVYNEGTLAGYAEEITDDIPEGLIYLPEYDINKQYEWKMFDKDGNPTDNLEDAYTIKTEYLSQENEISENRDNLIEAFDNSKEISEENPDYKDVKVAFRVIEPNTSERTIVNSAQISEDSSDDEDSIPGEWNDGEDDQDKEYIYVKYFDLSLLKWVTKSIVTVDGKTTTTETGFKPNTGLTETTGIRDNDENEPVAKVELDKNKLSKTTVKFAYKIRVTNEGEIAGYATEITDFIPEGLEFKAEDNKKYGWVKEGKDKVTTRALETVLLEPGESAELEIVFTWKKDKNNLGVKTNVAEITEDYNEYNSSDIDSTPDNKQDPYEEEQEDDDDFALVLLSIKTGKGTSYTILIITIITMLAGGIYLIKKYVLRY